MYYIIQIIKGIESVQLEKLFQDGVQNMEIDFHVLNYYPRQVNEYASENMEFSFRNMEIHFYV